MTVAELLSSAPSSEIVEWISFMRIGKEDEESVRLRAEIQEWVDSVNG